MKRSHTDEPDSFLKDVAEVPPDERPLVGLTDALPPAAPSASLRNRVLAAAIPAERLAHYLNQITAMLDIEPDDARALLARIDDPSAWFELLPGISLLPAGGGPRVHGALRGFVRVRAGVEFPQHEHLGDEAVMIMQGFYADGVTGEVFGPGDTPVHPIDSQHSFKVLSDGPDLLGLVVAQGGLRAQGQEFLPW